MAAPYDGKLIYRLEAIDPDTGKVLTVPEDFRDVYVCSICGCLVLGMTMAQHDWRMHNIKPYKDVETVETGDVL